MSILFGKLYTAMEWVAKFAYINLLWILFTLLGFIIAGFFPATAAMFSIIRQWLRRNTDMPLFRSYLDYYRKEFGKSNLLGLLIVIIGFLIHLDFFFIQINNISTWIFIPLFGLIFILILFLLYLFPAYVHFDVRLAKIIKNAFLMMLISPIHNFLMIVSLAAAISIMKIIPALAFLYGGSIFAFITMWLTSLAFKRIERREA